MTRSPFALFRAAALAIALAMPLAACANMGAINSNLTVEPGEAFFLGGDQPADFTVTGTNRGAVAVEVLARRGSTDSAIATVPAGESFASDFGAGETAVIRNTSTVQPARVQVRITGYTSDLGMRNEAM